MTLGACGGQKIICGVEQQPETSTAQSDFLFQPFVLEFEAKITAENETDL